MSPWRLATSPQCLDAVSMGTVSKALPRVSHEEEEEEEEEEESGITEWAVESGGVVSRVMRAEDARDGANPIRQEVKF